MRIKRGFATEYGKIRYDIEVEEIDLMRLLASRGVEDPAALAAGMPAGDVALVMDAEAEMFVRQAMAKLEPKQAEAHRAAAVEFKAERDRILDRHAPRKPAE